MALHSPFTAPDENLRSQDIVSTLQKMAKDLRKTDLELMIVLCWVAWFCRNKFIFEGKKLEPMISTAEAESILVAYQRVKSTEILQNDFPKREK